MAAFSAAASRSASSPGSQARTISSRNMTASQVGAVDNAFEEGQYDLGIGMILAQASPSSLPVPVHIRQLLYLALYPSGEKSSRSLDRTSSQAGKNTLSFAPSAAVSAMAYDALRRLLQSLHPQSLLRALPSYPDSRETRFRSPTRPADTVEGSEEAHIARETARLLHCKSCWHILAEGVIPPLAPAVRVLPGSPTKRNTAINPRDDIASPSLVGSNSWSVLLWLILLFEKDEIETYKSTGARFSPLLLKQIPSTRSDRGAKWDATVPLDIAFFCLDQTDPIRQELGPRLLRLLANLTTSGELDLPLFVNLLATRLTPDMSDAGSMITLFPTHFAFILCRTILSTASERPAPRARPQTKARRKMGAKDASNIPHVPSSNSKPQPCLHSPHGLTSAQEIVHLFSSTPTPSTHVLIIKLQLLSCYIDLQREASEEVINSSWLEMIQGGAIAAAVNEIRADIGEDDDTEITLLRASILSRCTMLSSLS